MRKLLIPAAWIMTGLALLSCGSSSSSGGAHTSGITYRAFVTNSVTAGTSVAGIYIVNALLDIHPTGLTPISAGNTPGMMVVTPNLAQTLVYSGYNTTNPDNQFSIINNATETNAAHVILPGYTESFVVSPDSTTAYVAVPNAPVPDQSQGVIEVVGLSAGAFTGQIDIPSVQYLAINNEGNRLLAFSSNSDSVAVVTPSNLGTSNPVVTYVAGFDRPVAAFFTSDDTTAYVINCGAECGGNQASVQTLDMTNNTPGTAVGVCDSAPTPHCAATEALVNGSTMYIAGTPYTSGPNGGPSFTCTGAQGEALTCGMLTIFNLNSMSVVTSGLAITDGYHNRIAMGAYGQLFIGASNCTEIIPPQPPPVGAEVRGCLSIYNSSSNAVGSVQPGTVLIPPENGNVTGIQPIATRDVVYVVQGNPSPGGSLYIYDLANDALEVPPVQEPTYAPLMVGNFYDVKTVDF